MSTANFLSKYRDGSKPPSSQSKATLGTDFDPSLISHLVSEHEALVSAFQSIGDAFDSKDYEQVRSLFDQFRSLFLAHLMKEDSRFYPYLMHSLNDESGLKVIAGEYRERMDIIGKAIMLFCKKYAEKTLTDKQAPQFQVAYHDIGKALLNRIQSEENELYHLYRPLHTTA